MTTNIRRRVIDRGATFLVTGSFVVVMIPLLSVLWTVIERGSTRLDIEFVTGTMRGVVGQGGGAFHAIVGTLIITGLAALISVPLGIAVAIYLVEYGPSRLTAAVTTMVDVMTGIPSIVAGLFAYSLFAHFQGAGARSGLAGAVALSVLMLPIVIRTSEELLRLVPMDLREAAYGLGVPKWRTVIGVVLPTGAGGIISGVTLALARVIGETAPLLLVAGLAQSLNTNPLAGRMTTLPVMSYYSFQTPGFPPEPGYERAWAAALVLVILVGFVFLLARILRTTLQPKGL